MNNKIIDYNKLRMRPASSLAVRALKVRHRTRFQKNEFYVYVFQISTD
jgi:hypothetical protein